MQVSIGVVESDQRFGNRHHAAAFPNTAFDHVAFDASGHHIADGFAQAIEPFWRCHRVIADPFDRLDHITIHVQRIAVGARKGISVLFLAAFPTRLFPLRKQLNHLSPSLVFAIFATLLQPTRWPPQRGF